MGSSQLSQAIRRKKLVIVPCSDVEEGVKVTFDSGGEVIRVTTLTADIAQEPPQRVSIRVGITQKSLK